jgi:trimethylamine---corrinoid protein Co-methyltransferase
MGAAIAGGHEALREKPFYVHYSEPTPPLRHSYGAVNKLLLCAERGIPVLYPPAGTMGGTTPVTVAGGIVQGNAEALSGLVMHQLKRKGSPIISGWVVVPLDMRASTFSYGAPETRLTNSAFADMFHYYGIPCWSTVGTDAHGLDLQASMEHAFGTLLASLDGSNLIHDVGYLGQGLLGSPAAIVMCDEIISYVKRILRGFDMGREEIGVEAMREVGQGGHYLMIEHTLRHFRDEQWRPMFMNRDNPDIWEKKGAHSYEDLVNRKAKQILATHPAKTLPAETQRRLDEIAKNADVALRNVQFKA